MDEKIQETFNKDLQVPWSRKMATHSSILAWKMPWTEGTGGLQSMGLQRIRYDLATEHAYIPPFCGEASHMIVVGEGICRTEESIFLEVEKSTM